jgi:hypothetical protein
VVQQTNIENTKKINEIERPRVRSPPYPGLPPFLKKKTIEKIYQYPHSKRTTSGVNVFWRFLPILGGKIGFFLENQ